MVYECDQCSFALPAGAVACPKCGEKFEEAVPADAVLPTAGFTAAERERLHAEMAHLQEALRALQGQILAFKSDVLIVKTYLSTLESEVGTVRAEAADTNGRLLVVEMARREDRRRINDSLLRMDEMLDLSVQNPRQIQHEARQHLLAGN